MRNKKFGDRSARECALSLLEYRDHTEKEMRQKLVQRGFSIESIDEAIDFLKEYRYLDDKGYAERYIRSAASCKSKRRICSELEQKGISREVIAYWLEKYPVDEESQICRFLEKKGYFSEENPELGWSRKLAASLCRKGFSIEAVRRIMREGGRINE